MLRSVLDWRSVASVKEEQATNSLSTIMELDLNRLPDALLLLRNPIKFVLVTTKNFEREARADGFAE